MASTCSPVFHDGYTKWTGGITRIYLQPFKEKLKQILETTNLEEGDVLTIGDYGCHDGYSSMELVAYISDILKERNRCDVPIHLIYEDQPSNDFNKLIKKVVNHDDISCQNKKTFITICPMGFYQQCLPNDTFHFIVSSLSVHFLSTSDISYKDSIYKYPDGTVEEVATVSAQAAEDWQNFLLLRAKELKTGGWLMLMLPAEDPEMKHGKSEIHLQHMWTTMTQEWRKLKSEGFITEGEYESANYTGYYRTETELRDPFKQSSPLLKAGLYLKSLEIVHHRNYNSQMVEEGEQTNGMNTSGSWAFNFLITLRQWSEYIFARALSERTPETRISLLNTFYRRLEDRLQKEDPTCFHFDNIIAYLIIRKH